MLIKDLPFENLPQIKLSDKVYQALQQMYHGQVQELPVVHNGKYLGMLKEDVLLKEDEDIAVNEITGQLPKVAVNENDHLLKAVSVAAATGLSVLPVVDAEGGFVGSIASIQLLTNIANFMRLEEPGALIVLEIDPKQYSFSEISKIIETNDAQITQLNTSTNKETGLMLVTLRLNKLEVSDVIATFQRYEYQVKHYFGEELYANELKDNYENLMYYLNI